MSRQKIYTAEELIMRSNLIQKLTYKTRKDLGMCIWCGKKPVYTPHSRIHCKKHYKENLKRTIKKLSKFTGKKITKRNFFSELGINNFARKIENNIKNNKDPESI